MPLSVKKKMKGGAQGTQKVSAPRDATPIVNDELPPLPDPDVLDKQLVGVLESMNIPKNKFKEMLAQVPEKKWQLVWGQMKAKARHPPAYYVEAMAAHMDVINKAKKKQTKGRPKLPAELEAAGDVLRGLEISLRTNTLAWVKEFLHYQLPQPEKKKGSDPALLEHGGLDILMEYFENMDEYAREDMNDYLCVLCLRALMNNAYGFQSVMAHPGTINAIVLCLGNVNPFSSTLEAEQLVRKYRTHILVLELLAAVCLVPKGHQRVLVAFNHFAQVKREKVRFQTLMHLLRSERHNIAVVVACMAFINVVVHCVPDMNYQVALQHEFTQLGILPLLEELRKAAAPDLTEQIEAYKDNFLNVSELAREAELRQDDLETIDELEGNIVAYRAKIAEDEQRSKQAIAALNHELAESKSAAEALRSRLDAEKAARATDRENHEAEMTHLQADLESAIVASQRTMEQLEEAHKHAAALEKRASMTQMELQKVKKASGSGENYGFGDDSVVEEPAAEPEAPPTPPAAPAPAPPPPPPAPPPPPGIGGIPPPPMLNAGGVGGRIKKRIQLDVKMPLFNWATLPHNQTLGTVFTEIDDEPVLEQVDFTEFKDAFKLGAQTGSSHSLNKQGSAEFKVAKATGPVSVLPPNKARNLTIAQRRVGSDVEQIIAALDKLDTNAIDNETAELLKNEFIPAEEDMKTLDAQHLSGKKMAPIDEFVWTLNQAPRLSARLNLLTCLGSCEDILVNVTPQMDAVIAASNTLLHCESLKKLMAVILALGNFMNSQRRGGVFGFKLSAFDRLGDTKSKSKEETMLHHVAKIVSANFPEVHRFTEELRPLEAACAVSLATIESDMAMLKRTVTAVETELRVSSIHPVLTTFMDNIAPRIETAQRDLADLKDIYQKVSVFFGETMTEPSSFFGIFHRLCKSYEAAKKENELRMQRAREQAERAESLSKKGSKISIRGSHTKGDASTEGPRGGPRLEVADGAIDELISEIKANAFRTSAVQMKHQKRDLNSANHDEFESYASARPWLK